jgi:flagellar biosynthetic protein FliR
MQGLLENPATWALTSTKVSLWMLVLTRVTGLLAAFPMLSSEQLPLRSRSALAALLAGLLLPAVKGPAQWPTGMWDLVPMMATELAVGVLMGSVVGWVLEAVAFGSQLMDIQMGFSFMQIVDPNSPTPTSVSGAVLGQVALLLVFVLGLHHHFIQALSDSYRVVPVGGGFPLQVGGLVLFTGQILTRGFQLAMPVLVVLLLLDVIQGISGKLMPQLQLLQLAFPLKIALGLGLLGFMLREFPGWIEPIFQRTTRIALELLR